MKEFVENLLYLINYKIIKLKIKFNSKRSQYLHVLVLSLSHHK